jgi:hypothetical protein
MKQTPLEVQQKLGRIRFPHGVDVPALQAADLLVYELNHYAQAKLSGIPKPDETILGPLLSRLKSKHDFPFLNEEGLTTALRACPPELQKLLEDTTGRM